MGIAQVAQVIKDPKSILGLLFGHDTYIDDMLVDVMLEERPEFTWAVTEKEVDAGLKISDNRVKNPVALVLEGIQFDDDIVVSPTGITSLLDGIQTWGDKYDRFLELAELDKVMDVQTPTRLYTDLAIVGLRPNITKEKSTALWFRVEFKQMRIVSSQTSSVDLALIDQLIADGAPADSKAAAKRGSPLSQKGKKSPKAATEPQGSLLLQGFQGAGLVG